MSASLHFVNRGEEKSIFLSAPELNVSNSHASELLASLGMNPDFNAAPDFPINLFEEKLNQFIAQHGPNSAFHKEVESVIEGNWTECGRRENYLIEKVWRALGIVRTAKEMGATHGYFG